VQLISKKLIAPVTGAMVVPCVLGLAAAAPATSSTPPAASSPGLAGEAPVSTRLLRANVLVDQPVTVTGALAPEIGIETVTLQQHLRHGWSAVAASAAAMAGAFTLEFRPRQIGTHAMRLQINGPTGIYDSPTADVNVFHKVLASWYGPGGRTACGEELTARTLGVANKTLPCGTLVTFRYHGRTLRVPVIDRGPFVAGRDYDLTYATKLALRANDLTVLWANH
jgi:rare lipoprotein A